MNATGFRSWPISFAGLCTAAALLISCSAPDRLKNEDISVEAAKSIVRDRLISPIDDQNTIEFNQRIPRRSILQVLHAPDSLSDPTFLQTVENQLTEELNFLKSQRKQAGIDEAEEAPPPPLSEEAKKRIKKIRSDGRNRIMFELGLSLETTLFDFSRQLEESVDAQFLKTVPLNSNTDLFPEVIGGNLTEDPNGYLSLPADIYLIGGRDSAFISKTAMMADFVRNSQISLSVRQIPLQDVLAILSDTLGLEYTLSLEIENLDEKVSMNINSGALSILDAILTQHGLAILFDSNLEIARFYTDAELLALDGQLKDAIRGHNELLFNQKKLRRTERDLEKLKQMIEISQLLLDGDEKGFAAGVLSLPRTSLGEIANTALKILSDTNFKLQKRLEQFDSDTTARLESNSSNGRSSITARNARLAMNDILVQDSCITTGKEIFVEKIAIYNADKEAAKKHIDDFFKNNGTAPVVSPPSDDNTDDADGGDSELDISDNSSVEPVIEQATNVQDNEQNDEEAGSGAGVDDNGCSTEPYEVTIQEDATGLIIRGRRYDNSLAVRLIEEYDVPRLQVLVEIFMVTVSRDFSRQISNLITRATNGNGGSGSVEAQIPEFDTDSFGERLTTTGTGDTAINRDLRFLQNIATAITNGYTVRLQSPNGLISSALGFIESNQLGRVLSSPTILVEDGENAEISRTQVAKVKYPVGTLSDNSSDPRYEYVDETAPFSLGLTEVKVFPANRTVQMKVEIENKVFTLGNPENIEQRDEADYSTDTISTKFTTAPGDVIVLAGLASNSEGTTTRGLPGTSGLGAFAPLAGGSDSVRSNTSEMIIFMVPTVIDPSSGFQPHSAF